MPNTSLEVEATTTKEIKIKPAVRRKLLMELRAYAALKEQHRVIEHALDKHKTVIGEIRDETGEQAITIEGFSICLVAPVRKKFDPKKFVTLGGDLEIYNEANVDTPSKPYNKISCPGSEKEDA